MNATNFNVKLIQIENVRSKRTHKRNETTTQCWRRRRWWKKMYQRKHSIDNINWMIMVGQSTRIEINFDELTAAMGFRNWIYMQDERVLRGIDGIRISFPIRKYCALRCTLAQEWAEKNRNEKKNIASVIFRFESLYLGANIGMSSSDAKNRGAN